jgi:hypothetical protein
MRSFTVVKTNKTDDELRFIFGSLFTEKGFVYQTYKNEEVWKKGVGMLTAPQIFRVQKVDNEHVQIEGWVPFAILPGVYVGEYGLEDVMGYLVKVPMRNLLTTLIDSIIEPGSVVEGYIPGKEKEYAKNRKAMQKKNKGAKN